MEEQLQTVETIQSNQAEEKNARNHYGFGLGFFLGVVVCCLVVLAGWAVGKTIADKVDRSKVSILNKESKDKLSLLEDIIDNYYYKADEVSVESLETGLYRGVISALEDPYSVYYTGEELEKLLDSTEGIYYGIGAYLSIDSQTGYAVVARPIENTPAQEAGLRSEDVIVKIDGEDINGLELDQIVSRVKGEEGTTVHLTIYRENEPDYLEMDIVRAKIASPTVNQKMLDDDIGYIQITEFDEVTVDQFTEALATVYGSGAKGLVLDLRSNPGGNLSAVTEIARQLLPEGLIVYTEERTGKRTEYTCDGSREIEIPLVVLVNGYSASASEILSGAIKDYKKGTLVGTTTFGKGIVQRVIGLGDGTAIKLTISSYYTPSGKNIHGIGIEPDVEVPFEADKYYDEGIDNQLDKAVEILKQEITKQ